MTRNLTILSLISVSVFAQGLDQTALDRYVKAPDASFKFELRNTIPGQGYTTYVLDMVSQNWLTSREVNRTEWRHWVVIVKPDEVKHSTALLGIGGGSNESKPPAGAEALFAQIAVKTRSVVAELRMVPNQPLSFDGESRRRTEDSMIAYTWKKYLETGDERWPARLPMTKAAVRTMDAVSQFLATPAGGGVKVDKFVVTGGSKRGWTTWTTAIVDQRVVAIMPAVIDLLNIVPSFIHHWRVYGFWAPAVGDYVEHGIMDWNETAEYKNLMKIVEPFEYRARLTLPKFIVNSTGDQFFLPDSSQFYFKELPGEKYLRYVPNTDHGVTRRSDAGDSLAAFYDSILNNHKRPEFSWTIAPDGTITVNTKDQPAAVKLWQANNPAARDFRLDKIGPAYRSTDLTAARPGVYVAAPPKVEKGYTAYFVELTYPTPSGLTWKFTTDVKVLPDVYPFPAPVLKLPAGATRVE